VPRLGDELVRALWGGYSVRGPTLTRFYSFHFIAPLLGAGLRLAHITALHRPGSSNPLGVGLRADKGPFHPYFSVKDLVGFACRGLRLAALCCLAPYWLGDPDNFTPANPLSTPEHIKPEWYFLFAYAVLRAIPNKLGGVLGLVMAIAVLALAPLVVQGVRLKSRRAGPKLLFWAWARA